MSSSVLTYFPDVSAAIYIQSLARGYLVRKSRRALIACIYRNLREEMDLLHKQEEQQVVHYVIDLTDFQPRTPTILGIENGNF
jgi:hypothetical protein